MTEPSSERPASLWNRVLLVTAVLVVVAGLALTFLGPGGELRVEREATFVVVCDDVVPEVADKVRAGDPLFTDVVGGRIGTIEAVEVLPQPELVPDAGGRLHLGEDPFARRLRVTASATARMGRDVVAVGGQVMLAGQSFNVISSRYRLPGTVVSVDVR